MPACDGGTEATFGRRVREWRVRCVEVELNLQSAAQ